MATKMAPRCDTLGSRWPKMAPRCEALGAKHFPRKLAIVDSPGIIGSPVSSNDEAQQYFKRLTRHFADLADVVLLFFDPDKPGTTKEANDVFRECLAHINSVKLHIVFNKVDAFKSLEDFGKAHGTLYWNLSAAMQRKDVPIVRLCEFERSIATCSRISFRLIRDSHINFSHYERFLSFRTHTNTHTSHL